MLRVYGNGNQVRVKVLRYTVMVTVERELFVRCLLCGHRVRVALSKSNRPLYSCFTKDGGCGCQFYVREEPAYQLFAKKVREAMKEPQ